MSSALSTSRLSARSLNIKMFLEENEKLLMSLENEESVVRNSDSQYYSDYEEDSSDECYPSLQQSIIQFGDRNDIPELKNSILLAEQHPSQSQKDDGSVKSKHSESSKLSSRQLSVKQLSDYDSVPSLSENEEHLSQSSKASKKSRQSRAESCKASRSISSKIHDDIDDSKKLSVSVASAKSVRSYSSSRKQLQRPSDDSDLKADDLESSSRYSKTSKSSNLTSSQHSKTKSTIASSKHSRNERSLIDSYQTYLETQKSIIANKWAREDAQKRAKEAELELTDDSIFMARKKPFIFTGIKRKNIEVYEGHKEEEYTYVRIPPNLPKHMSQKMKEQLDVPVIERLMAPKAKKQPKQRTKRVEPDVIDAFIARQMQYENTQRVQQQQSAKPKFTRSNPKAAIFQKLYSSSIVDPLPEDTDDAPTSTAKWSNSSWWWQPKPVVRNEPIDTSNFRNLRFNKRSMKLTKGKRSLLECTPDFIDVIEAERASELEKQRIDEFYSQYE